ncbi:MAG: hypothetical protein V5A14_06155 [Desulfohalobiaceae bacterium]
MTDNFKQALKEVSDINKFEMWLRFYFTRESEEGLYLEIPREIMQDLEQSYGILARLAQKMDGQPLTPEKSQETVIKHISSELDGIRYSSQLIPSVLNSPSYEVELSLFHMWVSAHEDELEEQMYTFEQWMQLFEAWKRTEQGQQMIERLHGTGEQTSSRTQ